jgi:hypothetical protein
MFAKSPMQKLATAETAAVAVIKSLLISCTHDSYAADAGLVESRQYGSSNPGEASHTQVPPHAIG